MKKTTGRWMALLALGAVLTGPLALGQTTTSSSSGQTDASKKDTTLRPPTPGKPDEPPLALTYIGAILMVGLLGFAALIPSKRGHQD
jgi:hypothetical protein